MSSETPSAMNFDDRYNSDRVRPVSLIMVQNDKTLITKTEYFDENSIEDNAVKKSFNQEMPQIKTEDEFIEGVKNFVFSSIADQCEVMSVIKSEEMINSELKDLPQNRNSNTEKEIGFAEHVISIVKAEENAVELAFDYLNRESFTSDQVSEHCIAVNAEAAQLFGALKTEPTVLGDFIKTELCEHNVHSEQMNIEPPDLGNIIKTEQWDYSINTRPYASFDMVENVSEVEVKTEEDDSYMFEYPEIMTDELNRIEHTDDYEDNRHNRACQKQKYSRKRSRRKIKTSAEERPLTHKRKLTISTKMKDYVSDYVPYTSRKKRYTQRKIRDGTNIVRSYQKEKHGRKNSRYNIVTSIVDRPLTNKRLMRSTKTKNVYSEYVPDIATKKINTKHRTRNLTRSNKRDRERNKMEDGGLERVQMEVSGIRESFIAAPDDTLTKQQEQNDVLGNSQLQIEKPHLPFKCTFCGKRFIAFAYLQSHLAKHYRNRSGRKDITCRLCGRIFQWETSLRNHLLTHTKEKPHVCKICKQCFSQESNLRRHMLSHDVQKSGERKYKCDKCEKNFFYEQNLKRHMKSHEVLPHLCHICGKGYIEKYDLHSHLHRSHFKEDKCSKKAVANQHQSKKQDKRPSKISPIFTDISRSNGFVCLWCGKEYFIASDSLKHFEECDKKPRKPQTETLSQNKSYEILPQSNTMCASQINNIPTLLTNPDVVPTNSSILPLYIQSNTVIKPVIPEFIPAPSKRTNPESIQMSSKCISNTVSKCNVTQIVSNSTSTVYLKPVLLPISSLLLTKPTNSKTIPIATFKPWAMPVVSSVIPLSIQSNSVIKPLVQDVISAPSGQAISEKKRISSKSMPNTASNISVMQMVSKPLSNVNAKPVIMQSIIRTQPTKTAAIPKLLPSVNASQVINQAKAMCGKPETSKMQTAKFCFFCKWCNKTFQHADQFKNHTYNCKPKYLPVTVSGHSKDGMNFSISDGTVSATKSSSSSASALIGLSADGITTSSSLTKTPKLLDNLPKHSAFNTLQTAACRTQDATTNSASAEIDLTDDDTATGLTETHKLISDNLTSNSALNTLQTAAGETQDPQSPCSESATTKLNGIMLPDCPFAAPLSP